MTVKKTTKKTAQAKPNLTIEQLMALDTPLSLIPSRFGGKITKADERKMDAILNALFAATGPGRVPKGVHSGHLLQAATAFAALALIHHTK